MIYPLASWMHLEVVCMKLVVDTEYINLTANSVWDVVCESYDLTAWEL